MEKNLELLARVPELIVIQGDFQTRLVTVDGQLLDIAPSMKVCDHSNEFNWGYEGSGPAQLALAILLTYLPPNEAMFCHQDFKRQAIAPLPDRNFTWICPLKSILSDIIAIDQQ